MLEAPFPVRWASVISLWEFSPEIRGNTFRDTLKRKDLLRALLISDLSARLAQDSPLAEEMRPAQEQHILAGGTYDNFM
jgi:hypothetical protein